LTTVLALNGGGGIVNTGLLEATNAGNLALGSVGVTNTGGNITASGTGSVVSLGNSSVTGGTLNTVSGGVIETAGSTTATLTGVTISKGSTYTASDNATTVLNGIITNDGAIQFNGGAGSNADLNINSNTTLTGGGTLTLTTLSGGGSPFLQQGANGVTLTNANNTIQGSGIVGNGGLTVANGGTIYSNVSGGTLVLNGGGGLTNTGTLKVGTGALLQVTNGPFTNFKGTTLTGGDYNTAGTLEIDELGTTGGEIVTNAAGITLNGTTAKFVDAGGKSVLTKIASNTAAGSFTVSGGATYTTAGNFDNLGTLGTGSGSTLAVSGKLANFSGTTLTGGTYTLGGILKFAGANVVTNDAAISLTDSTGEIVNSTNGGNGLANFAVNGTTGSFALSGGTTFTTAGAFTNSGALSIGSGSTFKTGGTSALTQTAGSITDDGTLAAAGGVKLAAGTLVGNGTVTGNLQSSGIVTPGTSATSPGTLTDTGAYTQNAGGSLNIAIGSATSFDALKSTTAALGGTLNISELNGFVPKVGSTFKIVDFNSETGKFATVEGLTINSTEAFTVTYQGTDVLLTVVSTAKAADAPAPRAGSGHVARLIAAEDAEAHLAATLRAVNAGYAAGGTRALAGNAVFSRIAKATHSDGLDVAKKRVR
jgi:hypothetical protein